MEMVVGLRVLWQLTTIRSRANMTRHPGGREEGGTEVAPSRNEYPA
jgi:hypothetical protein